jgi:hypothetical protein
MVRAARVILAALIQTALMQTAVAAAPSDMALAGTGGAVPLPSATPNKHMGVASCSSTVCHGAVTPNQNYHVQMNEYVTWSHQDAHSKSYAVLTSARSKAIAAKLGLASATTAKICLDCHADNVPAQLRGEKFSLSDGIGCEACHGGAERWLQSHTSKDATYREDISRGMYPTADLTERAELCLSCHYGTSEKFATHTIMAAGHPRLSFEMDTFLALQPPHYRVDADYRQRKPTYTRTQVWAYGQLAATLRELDQLQGPRVNNSSAFPELALFNCYGCHMSSMKRTDWSHRLFGVTAAPGAVPASDGTLCMAWVIARQLDPASAPALLKMSQNLLAASASSRQQIVSQSRQLASVVERLQNKAATRNWTHADQRMLLNTLISLGVSGEYRDYIDAEQAVMGIDGLLIEMNVQDRYRKSLDELYRLTQNDEAYSPEKFIGGLKQLQSEVDRSLPM